MVPNPEAKIFSYSVNKLERHYNNGLYLLLDSAIIHLKAPLQRGCCVFFEVRCFTAKSLSSPPGTYTFCTEL